jgi:hypothetical protein
MAISEELDVSLIKVPLETKLYPYL